MLLEIPAKSQKNAKIMPDFFKKCHLNSKNAFYTCQLFPRYKRETFIPGVLGFLKKTRSFPKIPEEVRSLPKMSEVLRRV